jgi:carbon storage regulator
MLVLTRRIGQEIVIGDQIRVRVVDVRGNKVRLAITAPESLRVDRLEIHERRAQFARPAEWVRATPLVHSDSAAIA